MAPTWARLIQQMHEVDPLECPKCKRQSLIERGAKHEVRNTGRAPLRTLNVNVPPAYRRDEEPLPCGRK